MVTLKSQFFVLSSSSLSPSPSTSCWRHVRFQASLQAPVNPSKNKPTISLSKQFPAAMINIEKLSLIDQDNIMINKLNPQQMTHRSSNNTDESLMFKLYTIAEAATNRAEIHSITGEQMNDWNKLLLSSINSRPPQHLVGHPILRGHMHDGARQQTRASMKSTPNSPIACKPSLTQ
ncbi:uncharacterized protein A4U43_C01F28340 [Asparagus officinalis]|uniref:Uncharacterized protein n=1 Tax=Asparagus officinalis TaxID=4686 RepID=A0A5P1FTF3_ASPOF|nr:uncharacterized protein A4U43_C01F28340 [Asparagus officinalis]